MSEAVEYEELDRDAPQAQAGEEAHADAPDGAPPQTHADAQGGADVRVHEGATHLQADAHAGLHGEAQAEGRGEVDLGRLNDIPMQLSVELGRTHMTVGEALALRAGSVVMLERLAGELADLLANGTPIARGEVVLVDERIGLRVTEILPAGELAAPAGPQASVEAAEQHAHVHAAEQHTHAAQR